MNRLPWHPWSGCSPISPSCLNCYAVPKDGDLVHDTARGPVFNGTLVWNQPQIDVPRRTVGRAYFDVCPHGDAFHENAPDAWLDRVFDAMEAEPRHIFSVMTKRGARMLAYLKARYGKRKAPAHICFGVGVERQKEADERIAALMEAPVTSRFLTFYSLIGPIDIKAIPDVSVKQLKSVERVSVGDGWLIKSADPTWKQKVVDDFLALGVPVSDHNLLAEAANRGF